MKYKDSGVDIDIADRIVQDHIKPIANSTNRPGVMSGVGGFAGLFDLKAYEDPILVSSTDGVGTKLKIAQDIGKHDSIGIDLVAMVANDILTQGAETLFFLDYIAMGKLDQQIICEILQGIKSGCLAAGCSLIGGETAEMPQMYTEGVYDLSGFGVGVIERSKMLSYDVKCGDKLVGIRSSGLHSNGFALVRNILQSLNIKYHYKSPWNSKLWHEILLEPTRIYTKAVLPFIANIKAIANITGGGIVENIKRVIPKHLDIDICYDKWPEIFEWLSIEGNVPRDEMMKVFNCGIGMVLITNDINGIQIDDVEIIGEIVNKAK